MKDSQLRDRTKRNPSAIYQGYLNPAPRGIDARYAWGFPGGDGAGVGLINIEQGWNLDHVDLRQARIRLLSGLNHTRFSHGTAVLGVLAAADNTIGGVGIVPSAYVGVISPWQRDAQSPVGLTYDLRSAIHSAAAVLDFGDILLIDAGIDVGGAHDLPAEAAPDAWSAIHNAVSRGVVVVEAAGDSRQDLDAFEDGRGKQVLDRGGPDFLDSGAIVVGGAQSTVPHGRHQDSNYGSRVDCYAWGERIFTCGAEGSIVNQLTNYRHDFGITSGAAAIIAGAAVAIQGVAQHNLGFRFGPRQLRVILSSLTYGTEAVEGAAIGVMPDLRKIIGRLMSFANRQAKAG